jgi:hypothetical protein
MSLQGSKVMRQRGAEALITEEPDALIGHVRICGGPGGQPLGLPGSRPLAPRLIQPCVPGMIQSLRGVSPRSRCKRSRRQGEGQGRHREVGSKANSRGFKPKPNPKLRDDGQEPAHPHAGTGCGTLGASGHVTAKPSIRTGSVLYKSGVYAGKVLCLTPEDLHFATDRRVRGKLAEKAVMLPDRRGEVSRGYSISVRREGPNGRGEVSRL